MSRQSTRKSDKRDTTGPATSADCKPDNGRDASGRFAVGNKGGPGNPYTRKAGLLRKAMFEEVTEDDMRRVVRKLVQLAEAGNVAAVREFIDRCVGKPIEADLIERLEALEAAVLEKQP